MTAEFEQWLESLPVQTLTDELKEDIVAQVKVLTLKLREAHIADLAKAVKALEDIKEQLQKIRES